MSKTILKQDTRDILRSLTPISDKFIIQTPKTVITDEFKQLICAIDLEKLGEDIKEPIGISEMSQFLNAVELVQDPEITVDSGVINIKNDKSTVKYLSSDLKSMQKTEYKIIESTKKVNDILNFELTKDLLDTIRKTVGVFKTFDTLYINKKEDSLEISLGIDSSFNANSNDFSVRIDEYQGEGEFQIKIPVQGFLKIPNVDYTLEVKYNKEKDAYRVFLHNSVIEVVMSIIK